MGRVIRLLGRRPRIRDPRVPHYSSLIAGVPLTPVIPSIDYTVGMPSSLGVMLNNQLGCCTCSAVYHALQVWSFNAGVGILTASDAMVERLYELACNYNPADPSSDAGGVEQLVLTYLLNNGAPLDDGTVNKIAAFVEVDVRNTDDVKRVIADCGVAYIGFNVPAYLMSGLTAPNSVWDVDDGADNSIVGGHAVILAGYNADGVRVISWGDYYTMTWPFFQKRVDEAYGLADQSWIRSTGLTVLGQSLAQLEDQMQGLREAA